jgi:hypothetical protein
MSLTAAHCAKTLILASTSANVMLLECARILIPGLIEYIAKIAPLVADGSISESQIAAVGEVWKAFSAFFASVPENHRKCGCVTAHQHNLSCKRCSAIGNCASHDCTLVIQLPNKYNSSYNTHHLPVALVCNLVTLCLQGSSEQTRHFNTGALRAINQMCYGRSFIYSIQCHQAPDCSSIILGNDFTYIPFNCESCNTAGVDYHNACQLEMSWH